MQRFDNLPWNPTTMKFNIGSTEVVDLGSSGCTSSRKCGPCEGDCDSDNDCQSGLKCYQRTNSGQTVPGCDRTGYVKSTSDHDYCYARCFTIGGSVPQGTPCVFPFNYNGLSYSMCTEINNNGVPWCSTTASYSGKWGNCRCN